MKPLKHVAHLTPILLATLIVAPGCVTYDARGTGGTRGQRSVQHQRENELIYEEDVRRLSGRIEGLEIELERLQEQLDQREDDQRYLVDHQMRSLEDDMSRVDRRIDDIEIAREQDKQEIINKLSSKMAEIIDDRKRTTRSTTRRQTRSEYGYEHAVQPGESLSEIAAAYDTSVRAIVEENDIRKPNHLRVGQKLFIPE